MKKNNLYREIFLIVLFITCLLGCPTQTQNVQDVVLESIYISRNPYKVDYEFNSPLDLTGLVVKAKYSDGSEKSVDSWASDPKSGTKLTTSGTVTVTITYEEKTASFTVIVAQKPAQRTLSSIYISKQADKLNYEYNSQLDLKGLEVKGRYSDGTEEVIDNWTSQPKAGTTLTNPGTVTVKINCEGKTTNFTIAVKEKPVITANEYFWGTWVRMDNGKEYEVLETSVVQGSQKYAVNSSDASTLSVATLGTFTKESDSVMVNNNIPYFRKGGVNLEYSLKLVGFTTGRAAGTAMNGIKGKGKSEKYKGFESNSESDSAGNIKFTAPTANDTQTVEIENGNELVVVSGLNISNSGDYMGTVALVGKDDYNLKITGTISDEQKDNGYLYGNNAKSYDMNITITNISKNKCTTSICTIETDDPNLSITSKDGTVLSAFTISTLAANATKNVTVSLQYGYLSENFIDTGVTITIRNPSTGQEWKDYVPLRFFKGMVPIAISCQSPEKNDQAALNGFIIYPDGNNQFFSVKNNLSKILYVPSFGNDKQYRMVFSGATVTSTLSDSTEMYYTVAPGTTKIREVDTKSGDVNKMIEYMMFGGNNHSENNAFNTTESFQAYLSEGEIDYYTLKADSDELYGPGAKSFAIVSYSSEYEEAPVSYYITEGTTLMEDKLPALEHEGLEFLGWYDGDTKVTAGSYSVNGDVLLTAKWDYIKYDITYGLDGGTNTEENPAYYTIKNEMLTPVAPSKKGYDFKGWFTKEDFSGEAVTSISTAVMKAINLYAKWEPISYKIIYVLNGGEAGAADEATNSSDNPAIYTIEDAVTFAKATRNGYAFSGWYDNESFNGNKVKGISLGTTEDITLYARWLKECTLTYETDHGTAPDAVIVGETDKISEENLPELECNGYTFEGWYAGETPVTAESYTVTGNLTLTAKWKLVRYTVAYYLNGGNNSVLNPSGYTIETEKLSLESPVRTGYDFEGWFTDANFDGDKVTEIGGGTTTNLILYAKWKPVIYTITYKLDGGRNTSTNPKTYTIETDTITLTDPQKEDYVFRGWFTEEDFSGTKQSEIEKGSYNNRTYFAKWLKKCTVSFVTEHGTAPEDLIFGEGESLELSQIPRVSEKGWVFKGWFTDSNYNDENKVTSGFTVNKDIVLYAKWKEYTGPNDGFVFVEGGTVVGSDDYNQYKDHSSEYLGAFPAGRTVTLSDFYISDHELTQGEYENYCCYTSLTPSSNYGVGADYPVYYVSWCDAIVYCNLLSMAKGLTPCYSFSGETDPKKWDGIMNSNGKYSCSYTSLTSNWNSITCNMKADGYRLPTEAEWEYAARGGQKTYATSAFANFFAGATTTNYNYYNNDALYPIAWFSYNSHNETHEVKKLTPNALDLYDMSGNVTEWCWDRYGTISTSETVIDPCNTSSGSYRVLRGGSYGDYAYNCSVSYRDSYDAFNGTYRNSFLRGTGIGFRLVRSAQ